MFFGLGSHAWLGVGSGNGWVVMCGKIPKGTRADWFGYSFTKGGNEAGK